MSVPPPTPPGAVAVTRRMLDDWIPDVERRGWWYVGSGMEGSGQPMTDEEYDWIAFVEAASLGHRSPGWQGRALLNGEGSK